MKKIFWILATLIIFSSNCVSMSFSQPVKIGEVSYNAAPNGGVEIVGATNIKNYSTVKNSRCYGKGIALFGKSLYFYFNDEYFRQNFNGYGTSLDKKVSRFGGTDVKNSVPIFTLEGRTEIYQIKNDGGIELYLTQTETGAGGTIQVFGTTKEGKWVKYFDVRDARKSFGIPRSTYNTNFFPYDDMIIVQYGGGRRPGESGEFRYKWNDRDKWFGVENKTSDDIINDKSADYYHCTSVSIGIGMGLYLDRNSVRTEKTKNGCIITFRTMFYDASNPNKAYKRATLSPPQRYTYNFTTKKIYYEKIDDKTKTSHWEYIDTSKKNSAKLNPLTEAEMAYFFAYGKHFFNKPITGNAQRLK